jgi:HAMP domain-containing protein
MRLNDTIHTMRLLLLALSGPFVPERTIARHLQSIHNRARHFAAGDTSVGFTPQWRL